MFYRLLLIQLLIICIASSSYGQVTLVKDINILPGSSDPTSFTLSGGFLFFTCNNPEYGNELWKSDGTISGTEMVKDINPGSGSSNPMNLVDINGTLFFRAIDETSDGELWKSDGTAEGTVLIKDIKPGLNTSYPHLLTNVNGTLFFIADNGSTGNELWKSDGTESGTLMVKDIRQDQSSEIDNLTSVNNVLYFTAWDGLNGYELWKSDGTSDGTIMVKDINPGSLHSINYMSELVNVNGILYFSADDGTHGTELWNSDGTDAGTVMIKDIYPGSENSALNYLTSVNGELYFSANDGVNGSELWKSDGTASGTVLVKDIYTGTGSSWPNKLFDVNGTLFFTANDGISGIELWKSDGTVPGTIIVKDINPGSASGFDYSFQSYSTLAAGIFYFRANNGLNGNELWRSDGTSTGTVLIKDIFPGSASSSSQYSNYLINIDESVYFNADDGEKGSELWKSDGTEAGTSILMDIYQGTGSGFPGSNNYISNVNGTLLLSPNDGINGAELWISDGTESGTRIVKDIYPGAGSGINFSYPEHSEVANGVLYFRANDGASGEELWKSDGTATGTVLIKDINPGSGSSMSYPFFIKNVNGNVLFIAYDDLWKSDGTSAGTLRISPAGTGYTDYLTNVNGTLFFAARTSANGMELWKSDGTATGTVMVKDINPGTGYSFSSGHTNRTANVNGILFFSATDGSLGNELWKSDGTESGTMLVKDIYSGSGSSLNLQSFMVSIDGALFFVANDGVNGFELWKSDGTQVGTVLVKDINPGSGSSGICYLTEVNNRLFFSANNGINGQELWTSDGTETGTIMVKDLKPGYESGFPRDLVVFDNKLYFAAHGESGLDELWVSDGNETGTTVVYSGTLALSTFPCFTIVDNCLYFVGSIDNKGFELLKYTSITTKTEPEQIVTEPIIYPNPTKKFLNIRTDFINQECNFILYDLKGQKVFTLLVTGGVSTIDLGSIPGGLYLYKIEAGINVFAGKLVISE